LARACKVSKGVAGEAELAAPERGVELERAGVRDRAVEVALEAAVADGDLAGRAQRGEEALEAGVEHARAQRALDAHAQRAFEREREARRPLDRGDLRRGDEGEPLLRGEGERGVDGQAGVVERRAPDPAPAIVAREDLGRGQRRARDREGRGLGLDEQAQLLAELDAEARGEIDRRRFDREEQPGIEALGDRVELEDRRARGREPSIEIDAALAAFDAHVAPEREGGDGAVEIGAQRDGLEQRQLGDHRGDLVGRGARHLDGAREHVCPRGWRGPAPATRASWPEKPIQCCTRTGAEAALGGGSAGLGRQAQVVVGACPRPARAGARDRGCPVCSTSRATPSSPTWSEAREAADVGVEAPRGGASSPCAQAWVMAILRSSDAHGASAGRAAASVGARRRKVSAMLGMRLAGEPSTSTAASSTCTSGRSMSSSPWPKRAPLAREPQQVGAAVDAARADDLRALRIEDDGRADGDALQG
jgi:hypothetical protein